MVTEPPQNYQTQLIKQLERPKRPSGVVHPLDVGHIPDS